MKYKILQSLFTGAALLSLMLAAASFAAGQQPAHHHEPAETAASRAAAPAAPAGAAKIAVPDVSVLDQNNRRVHFYSDLVKGRTVAINFIFTTCTTICPPMTANFARVQKLMLAQGEKDFQLISVSVDPENDTPAKLKAYAAMFHAQPGWTFVTGTREELEPIWKAFGVFGGGAKQDHAPTVVIGNEERQSWTYASGLTSPGKLAGVIATAMEKEKKAAGKTMAGGN